MLNGLLPAGTCFKICMFWYYLTLPRSSSTHENEKRLDFCLMKMLLWLITAVNILWSTAECRGPVLHRVGGGKYTWAPNMNLTAWAMHEKFYVGDWLYFGFDKTRYNVLEVSKMNYNNCDDKNFITNITRGGRDVFNLTEARPYYFLSGLGYCFEGMKVAVYAQYATPDPAPLVVRNGCPSQSAGYYGIIVMFLALFASM